MTFYLGEDDISRLSSLLSVPITENYQTVTLDTLNEVSSNPPHMLLVHMESVENEAESSPSSRMIPPPTS